MGRSYWHHWKDNALARRLVLFLLTSLPFLCFKMAFTFFKKCHSLQTFPKKMRQKMKNPSRMRLDKLLGAGLAEAAYFWGAWFSLEKSVFGFFFCVLDL